MIDEEKIKQSFREIIKRHDRGNIIRDSVNVWGFWVNNLSKKDIEFLNHLKEEDWDSYYNRIPIFLIYLSEKMRSKRITRTPKSVLDLAKKTSFQTIKSLWYNICRSEEENRRKHGM